MTRALLVFLLAFSFSCARATAPAAPAPSKPVPYQRPIVDRSAGLNELATAPVLDQPAIIDAVYRVRPNRAIVQATADIVEVTTEKSIDAVQIRFADGAWQVRINDTDAVTLPELVTFGDALSRLSAWASKQPHSAQTTPRDFARIDSALAGFYPRYLFAALHDLDDPQRLDAAGFDRAARASALLAAQMQDRFGIGDPLRARALALLAIARSFDATCCADSMAIMANILGYESEADQMARRLPSGFARAFVTGESPPSSGGAAEQWLLLAQRLHREPLVPEEGPAFTVTIDAEAAPALLESASVDNSFPVGSLVELLLLRTITNGDPSFTFDEAGAWTKAVRDFNKPAALGTFEEKLPSVAKQHATRLVDRRAVLSFHEANWYSATGQEFSRLNDFLGDVPGTKAFSTSLHPRTATGQSVVAWMTDLADAESGRFERGRVAPALISAALLGGGVRYELFRSMSKSVGGISPQLHRAAREMFRGLDERPAEMVIAGKLADFPIGHLARRDLYLKTALDRAPRRLSDERTDYLFAIGDHEGLRRFAADRTVPVGDRVEALCRISQITDVDLHAEFEQVYAEQDYSVDRIGCYWAYLNTRNQPALKERFARKILEKRTDLDSITKANIVSALANAMEAQGRYREAWQVVEPHIPVQTANILAMATSLLQRLHRDDEAITLGRAMVERYPEADTRADFAAVLWRMHRYDEAAQLFDPVRHAYAIQVAQKSLPAEFLDTFDDPDLAAALAAYDALIKAGAPPALLHFFHSAAYARKRWDFTFALAQRYLKMPARGIDANVQLGAYAAAYEAQAHTKGTDAALQWFLEAVPAQADLGLLGNFFTNGHLDLLTRFVAARRPAKGLEGASIIAAALTKLRVPLDDERWNVVRELMPAGTTNEQKTLELAVRHLLGETGAATVAQSAANPGDRAIASFFIGIRAAADGDYDQALGQFLAAGEGPPNYPPTSWATSQLYMWRAELHPWSTIKSGKL